MTLASVVIVGKSFDRNEWENAGEKMLFGSLAPEGRLRIELFCSTIFFPVR